MPRGKAQKSLDLIEASRVILAEIQPATVRAICYRLFVAGLIDSMAKTNTNGVSRQLVYAREWGLIPWEWVVDETREAERQPTWADPDAFAAVVRRSYRRDRWTQQAWRVEVWSEKGTVRGTLAPVLREYGVTFRVMHGYGSATTVYDVARESQSDPRPLLALYAGDWDPSGLDMSERDLPTRLAAYGGVLDLRRVALTRGDVADPRLPSFAVEDKRKDPRWGWFTERYGARCWELDALSPVVLRARVESAIQATIDWPAWERCGRTEAAEQASLAEVLGRWTAARAG
jgi:hypothetical protein